MSVAEEVVQDVQLGEEVALSLIELALRIVGPDKARALLDAKVVAAVDAAADLAEDVRFGPAK